MERKEEFIKWFSELSNKDVPIAGGKGASLAEMYNADVPVPVGFVITAQAYKYFIEKTGIKEEINKILSETDINNTAQLNSSSKRVREIIAGKKFPKEMEEEILEAYEILDAKNADASNVLENSEDEPFVAVRSSATTEDLADASFAGQQETFLNVRGKTDLLEKAKKCMSSLFTPRAIFYREKKGFQHDKSLLAVVVQKMIDSTKSGVMFSKNPVKSDKSIVIEAVFGLGEGIVSGQIKPDHYVVSPNLENFKILEAQISSKKIAIIRNDDGENETIKLNEEQSKKRVLDNYEIKRLAQFAEQLEEHYKKPQDIEFAIDKTGIYIVQSRPITTQFKEAQEEISGEVLLAGLGASPGIASGVVKIISDLSELEKVKKGDVLVTEMTNPDMVVSMQKSTAIVTDEGGVTCFSENTKVLTARGFMSIRDAAQFVNFGEDILILCYDAKNMKPVWKKIISAASRKREAIRISISQKGITEDNILELTPDHKMITFENRFLVKKEISSILNSSQHLCLLDKLPAGVRINNERFAYLIGALLSDGNISIQYYKTGKPRRGRITFTQKDIQEKQEFIKAVRTYFEECFGKSFAQGRIKFANSYIRNRLIQGVASDYICNSLEIAQKILKISQSLDRFILSLDELSCLNFLAGLIDGDGCLFSNRLHIYIAKENILQGAVLACLSLGILPQVTKNRNIHHVQILERISSILRCTKRVKGALSEKLQGTKLFSANQILGDIIDKVNYKGRTKPYVEGNLLIDSRKIERDIFQLAPDDKREELLKVLKSCLRMQRVKQVSNIGKINVYNLEVSADNELDHNFIVFTSKYAPVLVSNSHAAIVSREMGIPAVVGTGNATKKLKEGEVITVDGNSGKVYAGKGETKLAQVEPIVPTRTEIKVIVDLPEAAERAAKSKAKAVGLMRLEGIIASSGKHPLKFVKERKIEDYIKVLSNGIKKIASHFDKIWIRTSDIRSDEFRNLEGAPKEIEGNPMLGDHGIRFSLKHKDIMKAELLAVKESADDFPDKEFGIMVPQIISVEEVQETKKLAEEVSLPENFMLGIMIETPAAVQIIEDLCEEGIDFISFGTNDLTQYTLAVDRNNEDVQNIYNESHPAVLKSLAQVIRTCRRYNVQTSICGQAGSKPEMVKFLIKEGIDSISVNADAAKKVSEIVAQLESAGANETQFIEEEALAKEQEIQIEQPGKKIEMKVSPELENIDIEEEILKALDSGDYQPSYPSDSNQEIPQLNESIPVDSESFANGLSNEEVESQVEQELETEIKDSLVKEWKGEKKH